VEVVGEAGDGKTAARLARERAPDVVIMDVELPGMNGDMVTRQIAKQTPKVKVIALSMHSDRRFINKMLKAGACGYLVKECAGEELVRAIREVIAGNSFLGRGVASKVVEEYVMQMAEGELTSGLSYRELEVLQKMAEGETTKEIASSLCLSVKTIETHRRNIMKKVDLHSIAALTKFAIREGITSVEK
jgi:DNA-binding NarL/FixJ family response regulator